LLHSLCLHVTEAAAYRIQCDRGAKTMMFSFVPEGSSVTVSSQRHEEEIKAEPVEEGGHLPPEDIEMQDAVSTEKTDNDGDESRPAQAPEDNEEGEIDEDYEEDPPNKRARVGQQ
jgi:hypothetical protein